MNDAKNVILGAQDYAAPKQPMPASKYGHECVDIRAIFGTEVERPGFKSRRGSAQRTLRKNTPLGRWECLAGHLKREGRFVQNPTQVPRIVDIRSALSPETSLRKDVLRTEQPGYKQNTLLYLQRCGLQAHL